MNTSVVTGDETWVKSESSKQNKTKQPTPPQKKKSKNVILKPKKRE